MSYWIDELGFWGYMQRFPINPITIIGFFVIAGIVVLIVNAKVRKAGAQKFLAQNAGAAIMVFNKQKIGNYDYADNIRITKLNGKKAPWFFIKPAIPALYLKSGDNTIEVFSEWAQGGSTIKMFKSSPVSLSLHVETESTYSLEYYIPENRYIFEKYENPQIFSK